MDGFVVCRDTVGNVLEEHGLAGSRRGHDQPPLAFAYRRHKVHYSRGIIVGLRFQIDSFLRIQWGQVVKEDFLTRNFRVLMVDALHFKKGKIALRILGRPIWPEMVSPVLRLKRRIWEGEI